MKVSDQLKISKNLIVRNRIVMSPMDTMMANNGMANDFHAAHYGSRAYGGVGTIIVEATAVVSEGRITDNSLGIWSDKHIAPLKRIVDIAKKAGSVIGIQLNHSGSKSEVTNKNVFGVTKIFKRTNVDKFKFIDENGFKKIEDDFVKAANRAKKAGFDFVELHAAHGYLLNTIWNPNFNDLYKEKNLLKRAQVIINILKRIKKEVGIQAGIRFSVTDYVPNGLKPADLQPLLNKIKTLLIYINVSSGETFKPVDPYSFKEKIFRLPLAKEIKEIVKNVPIIITGNVTDRKDVDKIMKNNIDLVGVGKELLWNPAWVLDKILFEEEIDPKLYHWNNNQWYSFKWHAGIKKK